MHGNDRPDVLNRALLKAFTDRGYQASMEDVDTVRVTLPDGSTLRGGIEEWRRHAGRNSMAALPGLAAEYVEQFAQTMARHSANAGATGRYSASEDVRVRLYTDGDLPEEMRDALVARRLAPGLWETVVVDYPDSIMPLQREFIEGESEDAVFGRALAMSLDKEAHEAATYEMYGVPLLHVSGVHRYVGAAHLHVLGRHVPPASAPFGALVAFPIPELLLVHPIGRTQVFAAMEAMQALAAKHFDVGEKAISPQVYWWRPGAYERLDEQRALSGGQVPDLRPVRVEIDHEAGKVSLHSDDDFAETLQQVLQAQAPERRP